MKLAPNEAALLPRRGRAGSSSDDLHTPVTESPRSISRQAKLQRLLKQLHGQSTLPEEMKPPDGHIGPELRKPSSAGAVSTGLPSVADLARSSSAHEANTTTERHGHAREHGDGGRKAKKTLLRVNVEAVHELERPAEATVEAESSARGRGHARRGRDSGHGHASSKLGGKRKSPRCGRHG